MIPGPRGFQLDVWKKTGSKPSSSKSTHTTASTAPKTKKPVNKGLGRGKQR